MRSLSNWRVSLLIRGLSLHSSDTHTDTHTHRHTHTHTHVHVHTHTHTQTHTHRHTHTHTHTHTHFYKTHAQNTNKHIYMLYIFEAQLRSLHWSYKGFFSSVCFSSLSKFAPGLPLHKRSLYINPESLWRPSV